MTTRPVRSAAESINRRIWYALLRQLLRNREASAPIDRARVRSILILRHDAIGDMVVTTAAIDLIRREMPGVVIDIIASPRNEGVLRHDPRVRHVEVYRRGIGEIVRLARLLRRNRYDVVFAFVLSKTTESGLLANAIGGAHAVKVAVRNEQRAHIYSALFNLQVPTPRLRRSMAEILAGVVSDTFGLRPDPATIRTSLYLSDANRSWAARHAPNGDIATCIVLNISSGNDYRKWSVERNGAFVAAVLRRHPELRIVITASPQDHEEAKAIAGIDTARVSVLPPTSDILDIAAVLERAAIVVSPDTSIIHIASAVGAPALTLYSRLASHYTEWMPFGVPYEAVITDGAEPIDSLRLDDVLDAFERLLARVTTPAQSESHGDRA